MDISPERLLRKIDETCAAVGLNIAQSEDLWAVSLPGVRARASRHQNPVLNLVGLAQLDDDTADAAIQQVVDYYRQAGLVMGWLVGPTSRPTNLGERLVRHGLTNVEDEAMWGMVLDDIRTPVSAPADIRVQAISPGDAQSHLDMMAQSYGFGWTPEAMRGMVQFFKALGPQVQLYVAYVDGESPPVAWSTSFFDAEGDVLLLGGAATVPAHRGRGIYRAMVKARLQAGQARGYSTAIVQAVRTTSAPLCARIGFRTVCEIDLYAWAPPEAAPAVGS